LRNWKRPKAYCGDWPSSVFDAPRNRVPCWRSRLELTWLYTMALVRGHRLWRWRAPSSCDMWC
jgi:hypothetical protein